MSSMAYGDTGITPVGRMSRATGFTSTGKVRITKRTYGSAWTVAKQRAAYEAAMETGRWDAYLTDDEIKHRERHKEPLPARRKETLPARRTWAA